MPMSMTAERRRATGGPRGERGAVLVVVLLVMTGLLGLGVSALWITGGNLQVGANTNLRNQALYVAEAGIERARQVLNDPAIPPNLNGLLVGSNPGEDDVPTRVDTETGQPNGVGALMMDGAITLKDVAYPPASFSRGAGTADSPTPRFMGTYTVWIRNDTAEARQGLFKIDSNLSVVVRSRGVAPDGRTVVSLEVTMGPATSIAGAPPGPLLPPPVLCNAGKNACDDNNSMQNGVVIASP